MNSAPEKTKTSRSTKLENQTNERGTASNEPEEKGYPWQLVFIMAAFGIGLVLILLKIIGVI